MNGKILVTGATGYVGGRLASHLVRLGFAVRVLSRDRRRLQGRAWLDQVESAEGDALDRDSLVRALQGVSTAYYLIHGMQGGAIDAGREAAASRNFAQAAEEARVERIIYLGELADPKGELSPYLRSRHETGEILREGGVPVTEFRAGMIVGAGSVLFEMIRYLTERQPLLICPRWFYTPSQPIAIRDVLGYLADALQNPASAGRLIEIGGATRLNYADMLQAYARERQLKRVRIPAPVSAPRLSAYWVHLVTPFHWNQMLPLIEGLSTESTVNSPDAKEIFPEIQALDFAGALHEALQSLRDGNIETAWFDSLVSSQGDIPPLMFKVSEGMLIERRNLIVNLPAEDAYRAYTSLGGERGWLYLNWTWVIRGWMDKLVGGVGLRRGRRHPQELRAGESLDFWRVEEA